MEKLLTLIIPTYNMEEYLRTCLDSLIISEGQDRLEVLVINDGSKDSSSAIAHKYEQDHPECFHVIDKDNGNYGSCINRGLKEATGKYVKILDADDLFDTPSLKTFLQKLSDIDTDLVLTDNTIFGDNNISKKYYGFNLPVDKPLTFIDFCNNREFKENIHMHNVTYRRSLFDSFSYRQQEGISYTDTQWILTPMAHVRTAYYMKLPLYKYLVGREGQTVAPEQMMRCANHNIFLVNALLTDYTKADKSIPAIEGYMDFRLTRQVKYLYRIYLAEFAGMELDDIAVFDKRLKEEQPALYEEVGQRTMGPFIRIKYVRYWRRHNYAPQPRYFYTIFNGYNKLLNWTKKMLGCYNV